MTENLLRVKVLFFCLISLGVFVFGTPFASASITANYSNPITVYNSTSTLTDYQVMVTFQPDEFDFRKVSSTGADIFFTDEDDSVISHFIQTFSDTATSTIWVKVPTLTGNTTTTIYMNYGFDTDSSLSSSTGTFLFFDNFDNDSIGDWATSSLLLHPADGESIAITTSSAKSVSAPLCAKLYGYASCDASPWDGVTAIMTKTLSLPVLDNYAIDFNMWQEIVRFRWSGTQPMTSTVETNGVKIWDTSATCTGMDCAYNSGWQERTVIATSTFSSLGFTNHTYDCQEDNLWIDDVRIRNYNVFEPVVVFTPVERTCDTVANAATYNAYPTCGVATCNSGYTLTDGACVANTSSGGSVAIVLPPGIGSGDSDSSAGAVGGSINVGIIDQSGTNVLTYITNTNNFSAPESGNGWNLGSHNFIITDLDLYNYIATITFNSDPVTVRLKRGDSIGVDLDGDRIADIRATFTNTFVNRAEITVTSLAKGAVATSTPVVNLIPVSDVSVNNFNSKITFLNNIATVYQPGSKLRFDYRYPNEGVKSLSVRVTRQLIDANGKVIKTLTVSKLIKPGIAFVGYVNENLAKNLVPGNYTVNIIIKDKAGNILDQNGFAITVEKIKKKYLILNTEVPTATDISFDEAIWKKLKSNVLVPANPKFKFYYTNNSGVAHTVRMVRELIGPDGKVIEKKTGKWKMAVGENHGLNFVQAIGTKLAPGDYQLKITASDWTSKEVLAESSFGFTVELK